MQILTDEEIDVLNAARRVLEELRSRVQDSYACADHTPHENYCHGIVWAAAEIGSRGIFDVLNYTNSYLDREMTEEQLHGKALA